MIERPDLAELNRSWQRISGRCATEQRLAGRRAASGARLKPDVGQTKT
jgi:hypothetical protein